MDRVGELYCLRVVDDGEALGYRLVTNPIMVPAMVSGLHSRVVVYRL